MKYLDITTVSTEKKPLSERKYDLVMYGATGFTGFECCKYIAQNYPNLKWAIAGRSHKKLQEQKQKLTGIDPALEKKLDILVADSQSLQDLRSIISDTRVILSTVGPFAKYGNYVIALCAQYGTNYVDSTGECDWVKGTIEKYDELAHKSGANIVSQCGYDSVPFDMSTYFMAEYFKKNNDQLKHMEIYLENKGGISGGTLATVELFMSNRLVYDQCLKFDPFLKLTGKQEKSQFRFKPLHRLAPSYSKEEKCYLSINPQDVSNIEIVKRSNALLGYNQIISYRENLRFPNIFISISVYFFLILFAFIVIIGPLRVLAYKFIFPKPGQGPTEKQMETGYMVLTGIGESQNGKKAKMVFTLDKDPGYRCTARMLVESSLGFIYNKEEILGTGGVYTPASCFGNVLIKRLQDKGSIIDILQE
ncbi:hypothetical protein PPERSA_05515 [Pseudocohnilembus persalinus]|uniref:Saccharopine dehydrogenase NADP binding domain-containing protein n=1 Tax=Pseudocohnilembus persalinus TaxID=266149 RepID=A0A0V0QCQ0_PSEPJ|nr:hypothetical protein PPERSA_05515 [Pseudocohnilembus persalinus]|eukprot:KRX00013.1 hypothetical protein PPERSA_05515 [Pseudocohnilembus persalinus]